MNPPSQRTCRKCGKTGLVGTDFYASVGSVCKTCQADSDRCIPGVAATCSGCGKVGFAPIDFYPSKKTRCRECRKVVDGAHRATRSPEYWHRKQRDRHAKENYGISAEDIQRMTDSQGGRCAICDRDPATRFTATRTKGLHVDHDHTTGKVRAMLCSACNLALGKMDDDPALLRRAAEYLEKHSAPR